VTQSTGPSQVIDQTLFIVEGSALRRLRAGFLGVMAYRMVKISPHPFSLQNIQYPP